MAAVNRKSEAETVLNNDHNGTSSLEEKKPPSHLERPPSDPDVEAARPDVDQHPPMTFKRFMAIFSLGSLLAAAQIPIYLIGGSLCSSPFEGTD
jgi:hypothetical protein